MARVVVGQDGSVALAGAAPLLDQVAAPVGEEGLVVGLLVVLGAEVVTQLVTEAVVAQCTGLKVNMYGYLSNIYSIYANLIHLPGDGEGVAAPDGVPPGHPAIVEVQHQQGGGVCRVPQLREARLHEAELGEDVGGVVVEGGQLVTEHGHGEGQAAVSVSLM